MNAGREFHVLELIGSMSCESILVVSNSIANRVEYLKIVFCAIEKKDFEGIIEFILSEQTPW